MVAKTPPRSPVAECKTPNSSLASAAGGLPKPPVSHRQRSRQRSPTRTNSPKSDDKENDKIKKRSSSRSPIRKAIDAVTRAVTKQDVRKMDEALDTIESNRRQSLVNSEATAAALSSVPLTPPTTPGEANKKQKSTKKVSFKKSVKVKEIPHRNNMKPEVMAAAWLNEQEMADIRAHCKETILFFEDDSGCGCIDEEEEDDIFNDLEDLYTMRGLEFRTKLGAKQRSKHKHAVRRAVLKEQEYQRQQGVSEPSYLAQVSKEKSSKCAKMALDFAVSDAQEAKEYLNSNNTTDASSSSASSCVSFLDIEIGIPHKSRSR